MSTVATLTIEMAANVAAATAVIPDALWKDLKDQGLMRADAPV